MWKMSLLDSAGRVVATQEVTLPLDREVRFEIPPAAPVRPVYAAKD